MSKCDIIIRFDQADRTFKSGMPVTGTVEITVNKPVTCKGIKIEQIWMTHGKGNTDRGSIDMITITDQELREGMTYSFPYKFVAPAKPITYHGTNINVDHYIFARVDVPWAIDPKKEEDYILLPGPSSRTEYRDNPDFIILQTQAVAAGSTAKILGWLIMPVVLALLAVALWAFWWLFLIFGIVYGIAALRKYLASKRLGGVEFEMDIDKITHSSGKRFLHAISPNEKIPYRISFTPSKETTINKITLKLSGEEIASSGSGSNRRTYKASIFSQEVILAENMTIQAGRPVDIQDAIAFPQTDAYSFQQSNNQIAWRLDLQIDIQKSPDWNQKYPLAAIPALVV
jgi:hypothetical protein